MRMRKWKKLEFNDEVVSAAQEAWSGLLDEELATLFDQCQIAVLQFRKQRVGIRNVKLNCFATYFPHVLLVLR